MEHIECQIMITFVFVMKFDSNPIFLPKLIHICKLIHFLKLQMSKIFKQLGTNFLVYLNRIIKNLGSHHMFPISMKTKDNLVQVNGFCYSYSILVFYTRLLNGRTKMHSRENMNLPVNIRNLTIIYTLGVLLMVIIFCCFCWCNYACQFVHYLQYVFISMIHMEILLLNL